ncbi:unnamed protein product [Cuscuta europaea]|uniref:Nuclease HARBI1 n=1 Tax=Cuscuta europaea TaxID=41803 RepID=A0A9P0Z4Q6_CUSEU|nr:unnamed protein product [Cuscuta europaea]
MVMSSSKSEPDDDSSSSCYDSPSLAKTLFDEQSKEDDSISKKNYDLIHTTAINASLIVSTFLRGKKCGHGGTTSSRRYIHRDRRKRHEVIIRDYFNGEKSKYTPDHFRRRFRMDVELFTRILEAIEKNDIYFSSKFDATGRKGLSPLQKTIAAVRMLAYSCSVDLLDEYVQIGEITAIESLKHFCDAVISVFEQEYLRKPNKKDISGLLQEAEKRGFPGMLGSLDCMH